MQKLDQTNFYFAAETASSYGCLVSQLGCKEEGLPATYLGMSVP